MTTDTLTLTDFLLARIAEDEAVATPTWPTDVGNEPLWDAPLRVVTNDPDSSRTEFHLAINTARVLAECEAKRRLLRHVASNWRLEEYVAGILAAVYASHPDYREEWVAPNLSHGEAD